MEREFDQGVVDRMRERRDREIARTGGLRLTGRFITPVVGVTFVPAYPDNLLHLREAYERPPAPGNYPLPDSHGRIMELEAVRERMWDDHYNWSGPEKLPAVLRRNPDNEYDANALARPDPRRPSTPRSSGPSRDRHRTGPSGRGGMTCGAPTTSRSATSSNTTYIPM